MEAPWSKLPKTSLDQVTDCLMAAPGILQRVPLLAYLSPDHQLELILELVAECWQLDQKLDLVDNEIQHAASYRRYNVNSPHKSPLADHDSRNQMFLSDFDFEDSTIARTLILLWATRTTLWSGLCSLYRHYEGLKEIYHSNSPSNDITNSCKHNESMKSLPELGHREDYLSMAHNVCQSLQYFLQNEMGIIGVLSITPAIGLVIDALRNWPGHAQELHWLQESLDSIQEKGIRVLEYSKSQT